MAESNNVSYAKPKIGGAVSVAPVGTSLPTDASTELNQTFVSLGYISEDGVVNSNSPSSEKIKAWGGDTVLNVQTERPDEFKFKLIEGLNKDVLSMIYGKENVKGDDIETGISIEVKSEQQPEMTYVVDMILKNNVLKRVVIPQASITALEDIEYKDNSAYGYGVTLGATADSKGNTHYEYLKGTSNA